MRNFVDLSGSVFGRLSVISYVGKSKNNSHQWKCVCACGRETVVLAARLKSGHTSSCGCLSREILLKVNTIHGCAIEGRKTRTWRIWTLMIDRCSNDHERNRHWKGLGVKVCERWRQFSNFLEDMGEAPSGMSIDRFPDNNGNYEPGNCRWATSKEQQNNRRNNHRIVHEGRDLTIAQWADLRGWRADLIYGRISQGWNEIDAITRLPRLVRLGARKNAR